jgi:hypothetical protein
MWALGQAEKEYAVGGRFPYSVEQRARNRAKMLDRARWLALHGPYMPPPDPRVEKARIRWLNS